MPDIWTASFCDLLYLCYQEEVGVMEVNSSAIRFFTISFSLYRVLYRYIYELKMIMFMNIMNSHNMKVPLYLLFTQHGSAECEEGRTFKALCPSACLNSRTDGWIFVKFDIRRNYRKLTVSS
jgi:hypothetical protein